MHWYQILLIIIGCIISMYLTGVLFYRNSTRNVDGFNLLKCKEDFIKTDEGVLDVKRTLDRLEGFSIAVGICFPLTWIAGVLVIIVKIGIKILSPLTNYILNK